MHARQEVLQANGESLTGIEHVFKINGTNQKSKILDFE